MNRTNLLYIFIALVFIIATSLLAWYLFIKKQETGVARVVQGRGFGSTAGSFFGGNTTAGGSGNASGSTGTSTQNAGTPLPRVAQLNAGTIGGSYFSTATPTVQYVDAKNGNVYSVNTLTSQKTRLTNTLIPRVGEVSWVSDNTVIIRNLDDTGHIATFVGSIVSATTSDVGSLSGKYLESDIVSIAGSPDGKSIVRLTPISDGVALIRSDLDGTNAKRLWASTVDGWTVTWPTDTVIYVQEKAAAGISGAVYAVDATKGTVAPIAVGIAGLTARVNPFNQSLLYSESFINGTTLYFRAATSTTAVKLPYVTLAEKCVWDTSDAQSVYCAVPHTLPTDRAYPDEWYRGDVRTSDEWYKINVTNMMGEMIFDPENESSGPVDVEDPRIDATGKHISYLNLKTGSSEVFTIKAK